MGTLQTSPDLRKRRRPKSESEGWFLAPAPAVASKPRRRVLIVEEVPSTSNMLYALLGVLNCDVDTALGSGRAQSMIARKNYDAVLLDLRHADVSASPAISQFSQINPMLANRVLAITGEDGETDLVGQYGPRSLPRASDIRLMENVRSRLLALWSKTSEGNYQEQFDQSGSSSIDRFRQELTALIDEIVSRLNQSMRPTNGATTEELRAELQKTSDKLLEVTPDPLRRQTREAIHVITEQLKAKEGYVPSEAADIFRTRISEIFSILQPRPGRTSSQEMFEHEDMQDSQ
jgi:CheY-like chemotaxis protein